MLSYFEESNPGFSFSMTMLSLSLFVFSNSFRSEIVIDPLFPVMECRIHFLPAQLTAQACLTENPDSSLEKKCPFVN